MFFVLNILFFYFLQKILLHRLSLFNRLFKSSLISFLVLLDNFLQFFQRNFCSNSTKMLLKAYLQLFCFNLFIFLLFFVGIHNLQKVIFSHILIFMLLLCIECCDFCLSFKLTLWSLPLLFTDHHIMKLIVHSERRHIIELKKSWVHSDWIVMIRLHDCFVNFCSFRSGDIFQNRSISLSS